MVISDIRKQFPILSKKVYGKPLVYFDNAATSQRLLAGVELQRELSLSLNSNIHRAVHKLAYDATAEFEATRDAAKEFLNAGSREEIIFTSGTTASINLVASSFGEAFISEGDEIIVSEAEHHSNIVPWQLLCKKKRAKLIVLPIESTGHINPLKLNELINKRTKIAAVAHVSNVIGLLNPIKEIVEICHSKGVPVLVDGAQGVVHQSVDVQDIDCDFYTFSGHKIYAATGTGVLYGKEDWLEKMPPYMGGGEMIGSVSFSETTFAPLPGKFEAGTQNINSIPTLKASFDFIKTLSDKELVVETERVKSFLFESLTSRPLISLYGVPHRTQEKIPLFSFSVKGVHHEDVALILDKFGIAVRSGMMCAEPLMKRLGVSGMLRVSAAPYNTIDEAQYFIESLDKAIEMLL